jgi:hypothetical protein
MIALDFDTPRETRAAPYSEFVDEIVRSITHVYA